MLKWHCWISSFPFSTSHQLGACDFLIQPSEKGLVSLLTGVLCWCLDAVFTVLAGGAGTLCMLMETTPGPVFLLNFVLSFLWPQADELSNPFGQISLSRQGSTEAPDPSSAMFQQPIMSQHPQQTGFIMASPGQPITASNYSASGHPAPAQQVLQPQSYMQPPQQVSSSTGCKGSASIGLSSAMVFLGYRAEWYSPPVYIPL